MKTSPTHLIRWICLLLIMASIVTVVLPGGALAHTQTESPSFVNYNNYGTIAFQDPAMEVAADGRSILWHASATAPDCNTARWGGDGYVYMEVRRLGSNGTPATAWAGHNPFGPLSTSCSNGRYFLEVQRSISDSDFNFWPYWEVRYLRESEKSLPNPTVYLLARTTTAGISCNPTNVTQVDATSTSISLTWENCSQNTAHFNLERSADEGGSWSSAGSTGGNVFAFTDTGLQPDQRYLYRVKSVDAQGNSTSWSALGNGITSGVSGSAWFRNYGTYGQVVFQDPQLRVDSNGENILWQKKATAPTCSVGFWGGSGYPDAYMQVRRLDADGNSSGAWQDYDHVDPRNLLCSEGRFYASTTNIYHRDPSYSLMNTPKVWWPYWEIRYLPDSQKGLPNPTVYILARTTRAGVACNPSGLHSSDSTRSSISVKWSDCSATEDHFEIQRSSDNGGSWVNAGQTGTNVTVFVDSGLQEGSIYSYRIRAVSNGGIASEWSTVAVAMTLGTGGSTWFKNYANYGHVTFTDPDLKFDPATQKLSWNKEASAPTCSPLFWQDDGYALMQVRVLDTNGTAVGPWVSSPDNPHFSPPNSCAGGRFSAEVVTAQGGEHFELRYIPKSQETLSSPKVYMLARTTALGARSEFSIEQTYGSGQGIHAKNPSATQSDPVNSATGYFVKTVTDAKFVGPGLAFQFARSYTSGDTSNGPLGPGWTHAFAPSLTPQANGDVRLRGEDGQQVVYEKRPDGSFLASPGGRSMLAAVSGGYDLMRHDQVRYKFTDAGRLTSMVDRNGRALSLVYGAQGLPTKITDSWGREVTLSNSAAGRLTQITLPDGRNVKFSYTDGRLTAVTDLGGGVTEYEYDPQGRLSQITDANGHKVVRNVYGSEGRVVEQLDAVGGRSTFSWDAATQTSTMTDARGGNLQG